jgi:hypothetical protein
MFLIYVSISLKFYLPPFNYIYIVHIIQVINLILLLVINNLYHLMIIFIIFSFVIQVTNDPNLYQNMQHFWPSF